jgi:hypothetical protein
MRFRSLVLASIFVASIAYAKEPKAYQDGKLVQMDSVTCGADKKNVAHDHNTLCQEYVVEAEQVVYRVRPTDDKHALLLPIGENAKFRLQKNMMLLHVPVADSKERAYVVVSVKPRGDSTADATPTRLNHLQ